jgi:AbrB family looped-hinge helix DNA binding protein
MEIVTVSPKFQVVIPKAIRSLMGLRSGEKVAVFEKDDVIHLIRIGSIKKLRGRYKGVTSEGIRDEADRY